MREAGASVLKGISGIHMSAQLPHPSSSRLDDVRYVKDLETLRMLADPLRLSILATFQSGDDAPELTVKELADRLGEGQTKLYRHVKLLEDAGLIAVTGTRLVSGILEKRYRPTYRTLQVDSDALSQSKAPEGFRDTTVALLTSVQDQLQSDLQAGRVPLIAAEGEPDLTILMSSLRVNMTPERYARVRTAVTELLAAEAHSDGDSNAMRVVMQVLMYPTPEGLEVL